MTDVVRKVFGVRLPTGLTAAVKGQAAVEGVTVEVWVERALRRALGERPAAVVPRAAGGASEASTADGLSELQRLMAAGKISRGMPTAPTEVLGQKVPAGSDIWDEDFDQRRDGED